MTGKGRAAIAGLSIWLVLLASRTEAYIDPGSGTLLLQLVISAVAGAVFMARRAIGRLLRVVSGRAGNATPDDASSNPTERF
jgi:hypothetical protein